MKNNQLQSRFELNVDNNIVFATYRREKNILYIDYVEAPPELRGKGAAGKLMEEIAQLALKEKLKIVPICSYAALWLRRNKKYHDLLG